MAIIDKNVKIAKEIDDVMGLFVEVVHNRKKGEEIADLMDDLMKAIDKVDQVDDELEADRKAALGTIGYRSGELVDAFLGEKKPEVEGSPV